MENGLARRRLRLALLVDALDHDYQAEIVFGAVHAARQQEADLVVLVGGRMTAAYKHLQLRRFVFDLVDPQDFDGVILMGGSLASQVGMTAIAPLVKRFGALPMVSIGLDVGVGSTVRTDNAAGMRHIAKHLVEVHSGKHFALISGPTTNDDAQARLQVFRDELWHRGLELESYLVVTGDFTHASGVAAVHELADVRRVDLASLDALVATNDYMALGALEELQKRGLNVPADLALVGFDDIDLAHQGGVPLTTVRQALAPQGEWAVQLLLDRLQGRPAVRAHDIEPMLVVRRSCGCGRSAAPFRLASLRSSDPKETLEQALRTHRALIHTELVEVSHAAGLAPGWEEELLDSVADELTGRRPDAVAEVLETRIRSGVEQGESVLSWGRMIATVERHLDRLVRSGGAEQTQLEALLRRARITVTEATEQAYATRCGDLERRTVAFNEAAAALLTTLDISALIEAAAVQLPRLGLDVCSIALLTPQEETAIWAVPLLILDKNGRRPTVGTFPSRSLAAPEIFQGRPHALVVEPLCFNNEVFGLAAFEYGPKDGAAYEQIGALLSAAIKAGFMAEEIQQNKRELEAAAITDPLTGVFNRRHLSSRFREEIARTQRSREP